MNKEHKEEILNDLLPAAAGPGADEIVTALRRDRVARQRRKTGALTVVALGCIAAFVASLPKKETSAPVAPPLPAQTVVVSAPVTVPQQSLQVERINDEQLLAALGRPAAMVTLPDGRKSLMVILPRQAARR